MNHFNTTHEQGDTLIQYESIAESQQKYVEHLFNTYQRLTPSQAWQRMNRPDTPITSIRRAVSNLTSIGVLKKTSEKVKGMYGRPEYVWEVQ